MKELINSAVENYFNGNFNSLKENFRDLKKFDRLDVLSYLKYCVENMIDDDAFDMFYKILIYSE